MSEKKRSRPADQEQEEEDRGYSSGMCDIFYFFVSFYFLLNFIIYPLLIKWYYVKLCRLGRGVS